MLTHTSSWAMIDPNHWIAYPRVTVQGMNIIAVNAGGGGRFEGRMVDHGSGVIMPGLVNAHTHLSLSALEGRVSWENGFIGWIKALMEERASISNSNALEAVCDAVRDLAESGVVAVGEFGPHIPVEKALEGRDIYGRIWLEFFGDALELPHLPDDEECFAWSYAAHAPHTVSPQGLCRIKELDRRLDRPFCLHLAESEYERLFLEQGEGPWADFLLEMGLDYSRWGLPQGSPVAYAHRLGLLDPMTLAVHLTYADERDLAILAESGAAVCVCPRSNWNLHRRLPPLEQMIRLGIKPALGTDSLASVESLSIFDEMAFLASSYPGLRPETILAMATVWGAAALRLTLHGTLRQGSTGTLIFIPLDATSASEAALRIVHGDFDRIDILKDGFQEKEGGSGL